MMAYTSAGAKAYTIAHKMQLQAASGINPAHAEHIREFVDYANNLAEHYYQQSTAYTDKSINEAIDKAVDKAVEKALSDPRVELKVTEKSAQSAENSIHSIIRNLFG